jgi:tRNA(fMet)-specific endonuclease VapC
MKSLVDTDILSELFRGKNATVEARASAYRAEHGLFTISTITVVEVVRGWHQAGRPERAEVFRAWLSRCEILPLAEGTSWLAGEIGGVLARTGQPIGLADVCIAATAIHHGLVLVTGNVEHHARIRAAGFALEIDNWRDAAP